MNPRLNPLSIPIGPPALFTLKDEIDILCDCNIYLILYAFFPEIFDWSLFILTQIFALQRLNLRIKFVLPQKVIKKGLIKKRTKASVSGPNSPTSLAVSIATLISIP